MCEEVGISERKGQREELQGRDKDMHEHFLIFFLISTLRRSIISKMQKSENTSPSKRRASTACPAATM